MNLLVLGASGKVGRLIVAEASAAGHAVTALARSRARLEAAETALPEGVSVVEGDVRDAEALRACLPGHDAVLSAVGWTKTSGKDVLTQLARNLTALAPQAGVDRVVSLVGAGVADARDPNSFGRSLMRGVMKLVVGAMLADAQEHADLLRASSLRWTLVRPPRLVDGPPLGRWEAGYLRLGAGNTITRADVARFMLHAAEEGAWVREAPMVSNN